MSEDKLEFTLKPIKYAVYYTNTNPIYGEGVTFITANDDGAGVYIVLIQEDENGKINKIKLDFNEVPRIMEAINKLQKDFREEQKE